MSSLYPVDPANQDHSIHDAWSHRRSAAFVVAGGAIFWAVIFYLFVR